VSNPSVGRADPARRATSLRKVILRQHCGGGFATDGTTPDAIEIDHALRVAAAPERAVLAVERLKAVDIGLVHPCETSDATAAPCLLGTVALRLRRSCSSGSATQARVPRSNVAGTGSAALFDGASSRSFNCRRLLAV
jgi:hypothetical protein